MLNLLSSKKSEIARICRDYAVARLELFGSAARETDFDPAMSDLDFVVSFDVAATKSPLQQFFGLAAELESLFGRSVDLIEQGALRNPYIIADIERTKRIVYEA